MATTKGIRTWRRTGADPDRPVDERVFETTDATHLDAALREADFVTVPREGVSATGAVTLEGYDDAYASALAHVLSTRYGYDGTVRTSTSGRSHVFEREALPQGAEFDFGLDDAFQNGEAGSHSDGDTLAPWEVRPSAVRRAPERLPARSTANGRTDGDAQDGAFGHAEMPS